MKLAKLFLAFTLMLALICFTACGKEALPAPPADDNDNTKVVIEQVLNDGSTISTPMF